MREGSHKAPHFNASRAPQAQELNSKHSLRFCAQVYTAGQLGEPLGSGAREMRCLAASRWMRISPGPGASQMHWGLARLDFSDTLVCRNRRIGKPVPEPFKGG